MADSKAPITSECPGDCEHTSNPEFVSSPRHKLAQSLRASQAQEADTMTMGDQPRPLVHDEALPWQPCDDALLEFESKDFERKRLLQERFSNSHGYKQVSLRPCRSCFLCGGVTYTIGRCSLAGEAQLSRWC